MKARNSIFPLVILCCIIGSQTSCQSKLRPLTSNLLVGQWEIEQLTSEVPDLNLTMTARPVASQIVIKSDGQFTGFVKFASAGHGSDDMEFSGEINITPGSEIVDVKVNPSPLVSRDLITIYKGRPLNFHRNRFELENKMVGSNRNGSGDENIVNIVKIIIKRKNTAQ